MTQERIQDIHEYREATRAGMDLPDVKYAHEAIDELLDAVKVGTSQIEALTQQRDYGRDIIAGMELEARAAAEIIADLRRKLAEPPVVVAGGNIHYVPANPTTGGCGTFVTMVDPSSDTTKLKEYQALVADLLDSERIEGGLKAWLTGVRNKIEDPEPTRESTNAALHELERAAQQQFPGLKPFLDGSAERL